MCFIKIICFILKINIKSKEYELLEKIVRVSEGRRWSLDETPNHFYNASTTLICQSLPQNCEERQGLSLDQEVYGWAKLKQPSEDQDYFSRGWNYAN